MKRQFFATTAIVAVAGVLSVSIFSARGLSNPDIVSADATSYTAVCDTSHRPIYGSSSDHRAAFPIRDTGNYGYMYASYAPRIQDTSSEDYAFSFYADSGSSAFFELYTHNYCTEIPKTSAGTIKAYGFTNGTKVDIVCKAENNGSTVDVSEWGNYWGDCQTSEDPGDSSYTHYIFTPAASPVVGDDFIRVQVDSPSEESGRIYIKSITIIYNC